MWRDRQKKVTPPSQGPKRPEGNNSPETDPTTRNDVAKEAFDQTHQQQGEEHTSKNQQITLTMLGYGGRFLVSSVVRDTANFSLLGGKKENNHAAK